MTADIHLSQKSNTYSWTKQETAKLGVSWVLRENSGGWCVCWGEVGVCWEMSFPVEKATHSKDWNSSHMLQKVKGLGVAQKWGWEWGMWPLLPAKQLAQVKAELSSCLLSRGRRCEHKSRLFCPQVGANPFSVPHDPFFNTYFAHPHSYNFHLMFLTLSVFLQSMDEFFPRTQGLSLSQLLFSLVP